MIEEKEDQNEIMYQLVTEDIQSEALELTGRRLTPCELIKLKHELSDFIHWDFYVRVAIKTVLESENTRS